MVLPTVGVCHMASEKKIVRYTYYYLIGLIIFAIVVVFLSQFVFLILIDPRYAGGQILSCGSRLVISSKVYIKLFFRILYM